MLPISGLPLGIIPGQEYDLSAPTQLGPGDVLAFLTDGILEWPSPSGEQFGVKRVECLLRKHHGASAAELIERTHRAVRSLLARHAAAGRPDGGDHQAAGVRKPSPASPLSGGRGWSLRKPGIALPLAEGLRTECAAPGFRRLQPRPPKVALNAEVLQHAPQRPGRSR